MGKGQHDDYVNLDTGVRRMGDGRPADAITEEEDVATTSLAAKGVQPLHFLFLRMQIPSLRALALIIIVITKRRRR